MEPVGQMRILLKSATSNVPNSATENVFKSASDNVFLVPLGFQ